MQLINLQYIREVDFSSVGQISKYIHGVPKNPNNHCKIIHALVWDYIA